MTSRIKSAHEVYFLVRVGQMTEEDLSQWLQDNIDAHLCDNADLDDYDKEWDDLGDYECQNLKRPDLYGSSSRNMVQEPVRF